MRAHRVIRQIRPGPGNTRPPPPPDLRLLHYRSDNSRPSSVLSNSRPGSRTDLLAENRRPSYLDHLNMEDQKRRLSEAGVNRRPSAAHILTEGKD